jgi:hypothetical protein
MLALVCLLVGSARAASPLSWGAPVLIDQQLPFTLGNGGGVSCPSVSLCVAVDGAGNVVTSTDPTGGQGAWTATSVDGDNVLYGVSCPSVSQCVAVDGTGNVVTSTDPTGGQSAWTATSVDRDNGLYGVSCPSVSRCVAVGSGGNVVTSTDPTGGQSAWTVTNVDGYNPVSGVSCPSASLCVGVGGYSGLHGSYNSGYVLTSTDPTGAHSWRVSTVDTIGLSSVSCPSVSLCVAVDRGGSAVTSTDPTGAHSWRVSTTETVGLSSVSCPSASLCVAVDDFGNVVTSTDPTGGQSAWTKTNVDGNNLVSGVSCPSVWLCVAVDRRGDEVSGSAPMASRGSVSVHGTSASVQVGCAGGATASCHLVLRLELRETIRGGKLLGVAAAKRMKPPKTIHRTVVVRSASLTLVGGQNKTVTLSLDRAGKRLLARCRTLKVKLMITASGVTFSNATITFTAKSPKKKR